MTVSGKDVQSLLNDGYEWNEDRKMGVRMTADKISLKF